MTVLLTCDPELPVPPPKYGGIERLVDELVHQYKLQGNKVLLVANEESTCKFADKIYAWKANSSRGLMNIIKNASCLYNIYKKEKPDIIHSFSRLLYMYTLFLFTKVPILQTYEREINPYSTKLASILGGSKLQFTACGKHMIKKIGNKAKWTAIHNFTLTDYFVPDEKTKRDSLMFLGRIEDIKGTSEAIEASLKAEEKIIIAGNVSPEHKQYYDEKIAVHKDNDKVEIVGEVNDEQKRYYLQKSKALLFPVKWEEPFGIVMAESMACGTAVIAFNRGSVPEVIEDGKTGFIVNNVNEMADAIKKIDTLDKSYIRKEAVERFSPKIIALQYIAIFNELIGKR